MGRKLKLKKTPSEIEEKEWRRARKAARKSYSSDLPSSAYRSSTSRRRRRHLSQTHSAEDLATHDADLQDDIDPSSRDQTLPEFGAELQDAEFRAKMFDAMEDDERLDRLEESYHVHIPDRYTQYDSGSSQTKPYPSNMSDDDYAEHIRRGMYERAHRAEAEHRRRAEQEYAEKQAREKKLKEKLTREEREREAKRQRAREEVARKEKAERWKVYQAHWSKLTARLQDRASDQLLGFTQLPWPIFTTALSSADILEEDVVSFILADFHSEDKSPKTRVREALLVYHPDRYLGRYLKLVQHTDRAEVETAVVKITGILNRLQEHDYKPSTNDTNSS